MARNSDDLFGRKPTGASLKAEGCDLVLKNAKEAFRVEGLSVITTLAGTGTEFTIEAIHARVTTKPHHPNAWGALMRVAHASQLIRIVGRKRAGRTPAHARVIPIYRGMPV